jgi:hypothetical protein
MIESTIILSSTDWLNRDDRHLVCVVDLWGVKVNLVQLGLAQIFNAFSLI